MTSPNKRPAVTYHRGPRSKILSLQESIPISSLNPDAALQQKINDVLFSGKENRIPVLALEEEEFDSAYHETTVNAKKVHDLVQVGETTRFTDEIEYLLDGLAPTTTKCPKSLQSIRSSLEEIVNKCFTTDGINIAFGMKLKSHGALGIIFESLSDEGDSIILNNLILLICGLLYDVRRLDFFFKPELAIKLSLHCFNSPVGGDVIDKLKLTPVLKDGRGWNVKEMFTHVGVWILTKLAFSSITSSSKKGSFFDLILNEKNLLKSLADIVMFDNAAIGEKSASLIDSMLNNRKCDDHDNLISLLINIISKPTISLCDMKLAVSITGSSIGKDLSSKDGEIFFKIIKKLLEISLPISVEGNEIQILSLSCLINLIDRCEDSILDEFRYQDYPGNNYSLLEFIANNFPFMENDSISIQKSLLALIVGFLSRQNRTNLQVILKNYSPQQQKEIKKEILVVSSNFSQKISKSCDEEVIDKLNEIIMTFK